MKKLFLVLALLPIAGCHCNVPVKGEKVGHIVKIEEHGVVCKTNEAELIRGGQTDGSGVAGGRSFHFTIPHGQVEKARVAMEANQEVKVFYSLPILIPMCRTQSGFVAESIDTLKGGRPAIKSGDQ